MPTPWRMHWKVRPYLLAGGRTTTRDPLLVHTLVSSGGRYDPLFAASLAPETRTLYEKAQDRRTCSVAELSASCGMPLGLTRVLIGDLLKVGHLVIHDDRRPANDPDLLERLRAGLLKLA
ncbi:DUF742 domain-containing protein [Actinoplanes sp. GCM10030250]|uniref:DUF742 domain-containing protein n=1 Tax=Actinoplanes sp. GCM10030250 TaxID=3273376 RepID=UPI003616F97B